MKLAYTQMFQVTQQFFVTHLFDTHCAFLPLLTQILTFYRL